MTNGIDQHPEHVVGGQASRRRLLQVGGIAGALLATGIPAVALADQGDHGNHGKQPGKQPGKLHRGQFAVTGTAPGGAAFSGLLQFTQFVAQPGTQANAANQLLATGRLSGTFHDANGAMLATLRNAAFTAPVTALDPPPSCQILHLTLGPLLLNLLGLVVTIPDQIVLDITAVPGAGNLLGNLLCAVVNLLNPGGLAGLLASLTALQGLVTALNTLFTALNGL